MTTFESTPSTAELEQNNKHVRPFEVQGIGVNKFDDTFPSLTLSANEHFIAVKGSNESGSLILYPNTEQIHDKLLSQGYADGSGSFGVPYTGAEAPDLLSTPEGAKVDRAVTYQTAVETAGLNTYDWSSLSDSDKDELKAVGFQGSDYANGSLFQEGGSWTVSDGSHVSGEELADRAREIGTYALVTVDHHGAEFNFVTYTDQCGNRAVVPAGEGQKAVFATLGYRQLEQSQFAVTPIAQSETAGPMATKANDFLKYSLMSQSEHL